MNPILLGVLKQFGSKILMNLLEESVKELAKRVDNTVDHNDVAKIKQIKDSNVIHKK